MGCLRWLNQKSPIGISMDPDFNSARTVTKMGL